MTVEVILTQKKKRKEILGKEGQSVDGLDFTK